MIPSTPLLKALMLASLPAKAGRPAWWWRSYWRMPALIQRMIEV